MYYNVYSKSEETITEDSGLYVEGPFSTIVGAYMRLRLWDSRFGWIVDWNGELCAKYFKEIGSLQDVTQWYVTVPGMDSWRNE